MLGSDIIGCFDCIDGDSHIGIVYSSLSGGHKFISGSTKAYYFDYIGANYGKFTCVGINYDSVST